MKKHKGAFFDCKLEKLTEFYVSSDYHMFSVIDWNRRLNDIHIKKLAKEILDYGQLSPIIVSPNFEVLDGQHRLEACKLIGSPVRFYIEPKWTKDEVLSVNRTPKKWQPKNFLESGADSGVESYRQLEDTQKEVPEFSLSNIAQVAGGYSDRYKAMKAVKSNTFVYSADEEYVKDLFKKIARLGYSFSMYKNTFFVDALLKALDFNNFDLDEFIKIVNVKYSPLKSAANTTQYLSQIESVYNYNKKQRNRVCFNIKK